MNVHTAYAPLVRIEELGGGYYFFCPSGHRIGYAEVVHGFARYYGAKDSAHEGVAAIVAGGIDGLRKALENGLRSGRDDRVSA